MRAKRITRIHSPDSVNDKNWLKMIPKMDNFWLNIKNLRLYKRECPLSLSQSWRMMKNQNFSYFSQRFYFFLFFFLIFYLFTYVYITSQCY